MANEAREKHLLAGLDERARGFTRMVSVEPQAEAFRASLQYEAHVVVSADADSPSVALADLARRLHERGYTQLRSRLTFAGSSGWNTPTQKRNQKQKEDSSASCAGSGGCLRAGQVIRRRLSAAS